MLRNLLHIGVILTVGLASPTASVVRLSCSDSGATTLTMCTFETECASDPCCPDGINAASLQANCCRIDVFSLASASPVPASFAAHAVPFLAPLSIVSLETCARLAPGASLHAGAVSLRRNLPLLV